jgi:hypothetical protein
MKHHRFHTFLGPLLGVVCVFLAAIASRADLASELAAPGDAPQMRGLGVGCHWGRMPNWDIDAGLPLLKRMGVQYVRDEFSWDQAEKEKGVYALPPANQHWLDALNGAGIQVIGIIDYGNKIYPNPLDPDAYSRYAAWLAKTYKGKVAVWEIWNEPDNFQFFKTYGGDWDGRNHSPWVQKYSELVGKATAAIKAVDPQAVVIQNIEGASWGMALKDYPDDFKQVDGVDVHPYPKRWPAESTPYGPENAKNGVLATADATHSLASVLDFNSIVFPTPALGHPMQCWVGECGFSTAKSSGRDSQYTSLSEPLQAAYEIRSLLVGLTHGVKAWCIYDFICESPDPTDAESNFGLVRDVSKNHEPKPAFEALERLAKLLGPAWKPLPDFKADLEVEVKQPAGADPWVKVDGPEIRWFKVGDNLVAIVWKAGFSDLDAPPALGKIVVAEAPAEATADAVDLVTGHKVDLQVTHGAEGATLSGVPVGWSPVAIRWSQGK